MVVRLLKRKQVKGSEPCANATARILLQVVAKSKWNDVEELLENVQRVGSRLTRAAPRELVIGNVVRRVLGLIRDEATEDRGGNEFGSESVSDIQSLSTDHAPSVPQKSTGAPPRAFGIPHTNSFHVSKSLFNLLSAADPADSISASSPTTSVSQSQPSSVQALRSEVIDGIEEIMDEISQVDDQISTFAEVQIHPGDYILVHQPSSTVERFLVRAAAKRRFTVLIATSASPLAQNGTNPPSSEPYAALRKKLNAHGVHTINVMSSGVAAYMSKVNKVVLGAGAVLANGAIISDGGAGLVARAAYESSKAVLVLAGVYKLCPEVSYDPEAIVELGDSSDYVDFADGALVDDVDVESTVAELIRPELIDIYITNL